MDYRRLDLNLLVVFHTLLEEGGVHATARRLGTSQPNVSFALQKLRTFFNDDLFVRQGNGMQPTPVAHRLRASIRRILETVDRELIGAGDFDPLTTERCFSISTSDIGELVFLPRLIETLQVRAPNATIRSLSLPPVELARGMGDGTIDLSVGYFPDLKGGAILSQKLFDHPFICIVREGHPTVEDSVSMEKFLKMGHIVVSQQGRSQELFEQSLKKQKLSRKIVLQSPHFMSVPLLISASDLISTVPLAVGEIFSKLTPLKLIPTPFEAPVIELQQFWHRHVDSDAAIIWLRSVIAELFAGQSYHAGW